MFKIGNLVTVFTTVDSYQSFIAKIVGFDYDKEVVFVYDDNENTIEVPFDFVEAV